MYCTHRLLHAEPWIMYKAEKRKYWCFRDVDLAYIGQNALGRQYNRCHGYRNARIQKHLRESSPHSYHIWQQTCGRKPCEHENWQESEQEKIWNDDIKEWMENKNVCDCMYAAQHRWRWCVLEIRLRRKRVVRCG